jgi:glucoamylase
MSERRSGYYPASWNSAAATSASTCAGTSVKGTYTPATAAGAPNITCTVTDLFEVNATTFYGENIFLTGNNTELGNWDPYQAYPMDASNYTSSRALWFLNLELPPNTVISYGYVRQEPDGTYLFETTNRTISTGPCGSATKTTNDAWVGPTGTPS